METLQDYSIRNIRENIPRVVLEKAFLSPSPFTYGVTNSLDTAIELAVLKNSVCKDVQVIASHEEVIDVAGLPIQQQPNGGIILYIPPDRTGGRPIISAIKFSFSSGLSNGGGTGWNGSNGIVDQKLNLIMNAWDNPAASETTRCRMINPRTMVADLDVAITTGLSVVANLEVSDNMAHIPKTAWEKFTRMSLEKAKQLCYINLIAAMSEGAISRGHDSDVITNIINEYSSASENYRDLYAMWRRTEIFLDDRRLKREIISRLPR
jgi:hypothetical protein